jgi:diguanylate cyclase
MAVDSDEHERTMQFADIALGQIKALRLSASPRNYEIWYAYATGYHPPLNRAINDGLTRSGKLSITDLDQIYETYLSPTRVTDRIGGLGAKVIDEIDQVMAMIEAAVGSASSYTESLADVTQQLGTAKDREALRGIVETLIVTAKEMEKSNHFLENRLNASKQEINQLQQSLEALKNENLTDPLTSLANRKYFEEAFNRMLEETRQTRAPLSLILADIDHFKRFNDLFGHLIGDQVLRLVATSVKQNTRERHLAARYGGEEFAVLLPGTTLAEAKDLADRVRRAVKSKELMKRSTGEQLGRITVSIGVAMYRPGDTSQGLIERADACLYAAKRHGRNRVICETEIQVEAPAQSQVA